VPADLARPTASLPLLPPAPGSRPRGGSPFAAAAPSIVAAMVFLAATLAWLAVGDRLPGGRWLAVHLFTLGVLTNLVLTFSEHFSRSVTRTPGERAAWWPLVTNAGILGVVAGRVLDQRWTLAVGATVVLVAVFAAYRRLRRMRREAIGARFGWIVRIYERAHGAFIHGAVLGALLGIGVVPGDWFAGVRLAHLHANLLGWGGLTLLATLVFFGPTMARTRIEPGADDRAARWLRIGATALTVALLGLLLLGAPGAAGLAARMLAAGALGVLAVAGLAVCLPVARAAAAAKPTAQRELVVAVCAWLPVLLAADAVVVGLGAWRWLDLLGLLAIVAVLGQAILVTLVYLAPMLRGRTTEQRDVVRERLEAGAFRRVLGVQLAVAMLLAGTVAPADGVPFSALGWLLVALVVGSTAAAVLRPLPR
jgi:hypothetical protein